MCFKDEERLYSICQEQEVDEHALDEMELWTIVLSCLPYERCHKIVTYSCLHKNPGTRQNKN